MRLIGDYKKIYVPLLPFKGRTKCSIRQKIKASVLALPVSFIYALLAIGVRCGQACALHLRHALDCCGMLCFMVRVVSRSFILFLHGFSGRLRIRAFGAC